MDHPEDKHLTRRQFIKGAATAAALPHLSAQLPHGVPSARAAGKSELVIAKQGTPTQLLQAAMVASEAWAGL